MNEEIQEFNIQQYVYETLSSLDIPVFYVARKETTLPVVIFNITGERGLRYWDDKERMIKYKISVNIFSNENFNTYKNQILKLMKDKGFKRTDIPECQYYADTGIFNQPLFFEYIQEENLQTDDEIL